MSKNEFNEQFYGHNTQTSMGNILTYFLADVLMNRFETEI